VAKTISHGLVQATGVMIMQQSFRYGRQIEYSNRTSDALDILNNGVQR
jgi:hypothetical protein